MYELRQLWDELLRHVDRRAQSVVQPFTVGGKLDRGTPNAVGHLPATGGGTGHEQGAEPPLGSPATNGQVLASTTGGVRSWVTQTAATTLANLSDVALSGLMEGDALTYRAGKWRNTRAANIGLPGNVLTTGPERLTIGGADLTIGA